MAGGHRTRTHPVAAWLAVAAPLHALLLTSRRTIGPDRSALLSRPSTVAAWAGGWINFDGWDYLSLAHHGYRPDPSRPTRAVWFPLYPLSIRVVGAILQNSLAAAVVVAALGGLLSFVLLNRWMRHQGMDPRVANTALLVAALYPYGWFLYGGAYSSSLLLTCAIGTFLAFERDRRLLAAALGALAMAAHPTGIAVLVGLVVLEAERRGALLLVDDGTGRALHLLGRTVHWPIRLRRERLRDVRPVVFAPLLGLAAFSGLLWAEAGNPFLWWTGRAAYQGDPLHDLSKVDFVSRWITGTDRLRAVTTLVQFAILVAVVWLIPTVTRRFGLGYGAYVAAVVALPVVMTADFNGTGRYLLAAFPCAAAAGERLEAGRHRLGYLMASGGALATLAVGFGHSLYLT
jgi:hypothetical protein